MNAPIKRCSKCGKTKPSIEFVKDKRRSDGFGSQCVTCTREWQRQYRAEHPERIKESANKFRKEHPDRWKTSQKKHYNSKRDIYRAKHREYDRTHWEEKRERTKRNYLNNPRAKQASLQRIKARKRNLPDRFSGSDWQRALDYFNGHCAVCGRPPGLWHTIAMDHWIPLSNPNCPGTIPTNIVPLCHGIDGCNNSKGGRDACKWLIECYGNHKAKQILKRINAYFKWINDH